MPENVDDDGTTARPSRRAVRLSVALECVRQAVPAGKLPSEVVSLIHDVSDAVILGRPTAS